MKRKILIILILIIGIICPYSIATNEDEENIQENNRLEDGKYIIESAIEQGKVVSVEKNYGTNCANIQIEKNKNYKRQQFEIKYLKDGYYSLEVVASGKFLDVYQAKGVNGTNVEQYTWHGGNAQRWMIKDMKNGYFSIISACNGLYLDVYGGQATEGNNIQIYTGHGQASQLFRFIKVNDEKAEKTIEDGTYIIKSALNLNKAVTVERNYGIDCANVQIGQNYDLKRQQFKVKYLNDGYYSLEIVASEKFLDVYQGREESGTNVEQYTGNGGDAQKWIIKDMKNGYYSLISKCNNLYLDVYGGSSAEGTNIQVYAGHGQASQLFKFVEVKESNKQPIKDGIYNIQTAIDENRYIEVADGSLENLGNVQIWSKANGQKQQFKVEYLGEGEYKIQAMHSGKVLDVFGCQNWDGVNVEQYDWHGGSAQRWIIKEETDGYYSIISKCNDLCLDVYNGINANGTNIQMKENRNYKSQRFKFINVDENKDGMLVDGVYSIKTALDENMNLDVLKGDMNDCANVAIWRANNGLQQRFRVTYQRDGYYEIQAMHSGKLLDVYGSLKENGTNVEQYRSNGSDGQKWYIKNVGNEYYTIMSKCNGLYLDVNGARTENGTNIQVYQGHGLASQKFKFETIHFGIDVSRFQKEIDFDKLINSGRIEFMISRAGYYSETRGQFIIDPTFERNYKKCKENNIPVGTYIYSYAVTVDEARREAEGLLKYLQSIGATSFELPIFFDIEDPSQQKLTKKEATDISKTFCETIKNAGYKTGIYASKYWWMEKIDISQLPDDYTIWVASYGLNDGYIPDEIYQYKGKHDIWQYTSSEVLPGITGKVDMNISYVDWKKY